MISIVVPCYDEEDALPIFYDEVSNVLKKVGEDYELIFVDDGSKDKTLEVLCSFAQKDSRVFYLSLSRNFGKEAAMYAGFCNVHGDYVAVMDADMQDPPSLLPKMLDIIRNENYDCVATHRVTRKGEPPVRSWFAKKFYKLINRISDADIVDGARDFRLMKRKMVDAIVSLSEYDRFSKGIFGWIGFRTFWMPYENVERVAGKTKWSFRKLLKYAVDGIIDFSQTPLKISAWLGALMTAGSIIWLIVMLICSLVSKFHITTLMIMIFALTLIGGIQLICIGILGQYIAKTYMESKERPHYIISVSNIDNAKLFQ